MLRARDAARQADFVPEKSVCNRIMNDLRVFPMETERNGPKINRHYANTVERYCTYVTVRLCCEILQKEYVV